MIFPLLVPLFANLKGRGRMLSLMGMVAFFLGLKYGLGPLESFDHSPTINMIAKFAIFRCLGGFLLGMLLYEFYRHRTGFNLLKNSWCFVALSVCTLLAMHLGAEQLLIVALFPLLLLTAAYNTGSVKKLLDTPPLQRLGDWSFSIYMVHMPISFMLGIPDIIQDPALYADFMKLISRQPDYGLGVWKCIQLVVLTLLVAPLTYYYIEVPARNYLNRLFAAKKQKVAA
jgi:peptidoglycan/LPS O-acetylase OafA/YrhL